MAHMTSPVLHNLRQQVYTLVEGEHSLSGRIFNGFILLLIVGNVIAIVLESVESVYAAHRLFFDRFETFSVLVFTLEYLLRLWVCVEETRYYRPVRGRLRYMVSFMAVVDLAAILPFYLSMFTALDTRFLRVLRLLRVFKLTRHFRSLEVLIQVIRQEGPVLASAMFILMVLIVLAAGGMYVVEHDVQPEAFGSIPHAMWWAAVTLTTVGYGDTIPITVAGKMFAVAITILGVGMAAMPAGIIASGFTRELQKRRDMFQNSVREALEDGFITPEEQKHLEDMRKRLGLDPEDAQAVTRAEFALMCELESSHCPHCGKKLSGS
ncbi:ion transporter [Mariprofundus ferrooxydans]|uniref:Kef-type K+ transport systems, predicted NAD-binding component n=1 Tax=Mariprofundus ferrooxydans PV-1 TaxID=314345 RepID=Q0F039_9PROT|nr:ion transporter [Mariprofundus ferrooxydans]EAU54845.1 Kef-type K+ transport systems, predicted NAD-binding component [Mariprofundus ferrooxydans PV-1]KON46359.1 potassium channel protein [Mariprofundus ferrooxydans]